MIRDYLSVLLIVMIFSGCIAPGEKVVPQDAPVNPPSRLLPSPAPQSSPIPLYTSAAAQTVSSPAATIGPQIAHSDGKANGNRSVAVEVDYRKYVDWFKNHNTNIRAYTPEEYVCGQYTVDMINDSEKDGFKAYFAAVTFSDGTGHALVSFKSTFSGYASWYFFEPQTNNLMTPETLAKELNKKMGKTAKEVNIYGYFDDAGDKDPTSWRFYYPLYNKEY